MPLMDLHLTPTQTKSPEDSEIDTPPHVRAGADERKSRRRRPPPQAVVVYKECMRNHAAAMGGQAVDGCGEYMPTPSAAPKDPSSLTCAACGCHRNFHRCEPCWPTAAITPPFLDFRCPPQARPAFSLSPPPHMLLSLGTAVAAEEHHQESETPMAENPIGRKRFRTKFSQEQKQKMHAFSEKLGWKMHKSDEAAVKKFCLAAGVSKGILKVWMHNNKNTLGKKETVNGRSPVSSENDINGGNSSSKTDEEIRKKDNGDHFQNESGSRDRFLDSNNGSCSSP